MSTGLLPKQLAKSFVTRRGQKLNGIGRKHDTVEQRSGLVVTTPGLEIIADGLLDPGMLRLIGVRVNRRLRFPRTSGHEARVFAELLLSGPSAR